jgi:hypothetical protein
MSDIPYGISSAGLVLNELVRNNKHDKKRVSHIIEQLYSILNFIYDSCDKGTYGCLWLGIKKDFMGRVKNSNINNNTREYLETTVIGILRQKRREYLIIKGNLGKRATAELKESNKKHYDNFVEKAKELGCL